MLMCLGWTNKGPRVLLGCWGCLASHWEPSAPCFPLILPIQCLVTTYGKGRLMKISTHLEFMIIDLVPSSCSDLVWRKAKVYDLWSSVVLDTPDCTGAVVSRQVAMFSCYDWSTLSLCVSLLSPTSIISSPSVLLHSAWDRSRIFSSSLSHLHYVWWLLAITS